MRTQHRKIYRLGALVLAALLWAGCGRPVQPSQHDEPAAGDDTQVGRAFKTRASGVQVAGEGVVASMLPDDLSGRRHQRFIVRLASGQTVLIEHNIDIAPRIDGLQPGDTISFFGEYVWNEKGGMVHWTHHDPQGKHVAGWLKYKGRTYQ